MPRLTSLFLALLALAGAALGMHTARVVAVGETSVFLPAVSCPGCTGGDPQPTPENPDPLEARMVELVNQARAAAGCPAAMPSPTLMRAAGDWSEYMRVHNIGEHAPSNWYSSSPYFYPTDAVLENIAGGSDVPDYVFSLWMQSSLHRRNIEFCYHPDNPSYTPDRLYELGAGYSDGYWTLAIADRAP